MGIELRLARVVSVFVGATATVMIVALIEAGGWVVLHDGFGMGDLPALLFWSFPFGGVVATAVVALRSTERPKDRALRVFVAIALGALLGLVWTLLMVQMMGPWFGTLSVPVLPILSISGALTLGVFASYRSLGG